MKIDWGQKDYDDIGIEFLKLQWGKLTLGQGLEKKEKQAEKISSI